MKLKDKAYMFVTECRELFFLGAGSGCAVRYRTGHRKSGRLVRAVLSLSTSSKTSKSVIIFVTDAHGLCSCGFFSKRTLPVDDSISTADGADMLSALRAFTFNPTNGNNKNTAHNVIETNAFLTTKNTSVLNMNKVSNVCNKICAFFEAVTV